MNSGIFCLESAQAAKPGGLGVGCRRSGIPISGRRPNSWVLIEEFNLSYHNLRFLCRIYKGSFKGIGFNLRFKLP